jgi:hypothetical protein
MGILRAQVQTVIEPVPTHRQKYRQSMIGLELVDFLYQQMMKMIMILYENTIE